MHIVFKSTFGSKLSTYVGHKYFISQTIFSLMHIILHFFDFLTPVLPSMFIITKGSLFFCFIISAISCIKTALRIWFWNEDLLQVFYLIRITQTVKSCFLHHLNFTSAMILDKHYRIKSVINSFFKGVHNYWMYRIPPDCTASLYHPHL